MNEVTAIERANELHEEIREHKRAQQWHKRKVRVSMAEFERLCKEHHITLTQITEKEIKVNGNERAA